MGDAIVFVYRYGHFSLRGLFTYISSIRGTTAAAISAYIRIGSVYFPMTTSAENELKEALFLPKQPRDKRA